MNTTPSPMSPQRQLGTMIKGFRQSFNLAQSELAERAGITQGSIARFEAGLGNPTYKTLEKLAGAMNLHLVVSFERPARRIKRVAD